MIPVGIPGGIVHPSWMEANAPYDTTMISSGSVTASVGLGIGVLRYYPVLVPYPASIAAFDCTMSNATGQTGRCGIWDVDPANGLPGALLWDSGVITYTGTGMMSLAVSPTIPVDSGYLWLGQVASAAMNVYGQPTIDGTRMGVNLIGTGTKYAGPFRSFPTMTDPLPDPAVFTGGFSTFQVRLGLRYA